VCVAVTKGGYLDLRSVTVFKGAGRKYADGRIKLSVGSTVLVELGATFTAERSVAFGLAMIKIMVMVVVMMDDGDDDDDYDGDGDDDDDDDDGDDDEGQAERWVHRAGGAGSNLHCRKIRGFCPTLMLAY
jgi:hypothetical protein